MHRPLLEDCFNVEIYSGFADHWRAIDSSVHLFINQSRDEEQLMAQPFETLRLALSAAYAVLAFSGRSKSEQISRYHRCDEYLDVYDECRDAYDAVKRDLLVACRESKEISTATQGPSPEASLMTYSASAENTHSRGGINCYIGRDQTPFLSTDSNPSTNSSYEQSQLKDCLA